MKVSFDKLEWSGRYLDHDNVRYFDFSASGFSFTLKGTKATATILSDASKFEELYRGVLGVYVTRQNTEEFFKVQLNKDENEVCLFESEKEEEVHIQVIRLSEAVYGYSGLKTLEVEGTILKSCEQNSEPKLKVEVIGDSITCGYGIEGVFGKDVFTTMQERPDLAYAYKTMKKINADFHLVSRSGIGLISCYIDPATVMLPNLAEPLMSQLWPYTDRFLSVRLGLEPEVWDESRFSPDLVILHLGTNDASWVRGLEDRKQSFTNLYKQMLEAIHRRSPKAKILGCLGAMGQDLCEAEKKAFEEFSKDFPAVQTKYVEFPVQDEQNDGVGTDWHPSAVTHEKVAAQLAKAIQNW